jgi:hypothetical protein
MAVAPGTQDVEKADWLTPGVRGIGTASLFADLGHEVPTALLPSFLTSTLAAPATALGLIEGVSDGLAGAARLGGGALADDPERRRKAAIGGYATTAVLSGLIGTASNAWQVGVLRAGAWTARGLRVPARNALLADVVPTSAYGRTYGFERAMDNLGAIGGPLLALGLVELVGVRTAILLRSSLACWRWSRSSTPSGTPPARPRPSVSRSGCGSAPCCAAASGGSWQGSACSSSPTSPPRC